MYETAQFPVEVINQQFKGQKIVDYDISEDSMIVLLENNEVYWSGMKLEYQPTLLKLNADRN